MIRYYGFRDVNGIEIIQSIKNTFLLKKVLTLLIYASIINSVDPI